MAHRSKLYPVHTSKDGPAGSAVPIGWVIIVQDNIAYYIREAQSCNDSQP